MAPIAPVETKDQGNGLEMHAEASKASDQVSRLQSVCSAPSSGRRGAACVRLQTRVNHHYQLKTAVLEGLVGQGVLVAPEPESSSDTEGAESSPGSKLDVRLKVRLQRLQMEREGQEREFQLRRELELKKLEAETAIRMREVELQASSIFSEASACHTDRNGPWQRQRYQ
ncbi:unnamed protein product [Lota lota]